jgi:hypothetical protein
MDLVHNVGHNHRFVVAELVAELQSESPAMLQSHVVKEAGALARTDKFWSCGCLMIRTF